MGLRLPIGISDFRQIREGGLHYVDKTLFIEDVLSSTAQCLLLPRPRRFGKTLNLSALRAFLEAGDEDLRHLFAGLAIERSSLRERHQGRYPVLFLTFKDLKEPSFEAFGRRLLKLLSDECERHRELADSPRLSAEARTRFRHLLERRADLVEAEDALRELSVWLQRHHGRPVAILIDEYDTPLHAAFAHGYYDEAIGFLRNFLSGGLKDNPHLFKGVLTGILRVAKESIFSGLNNVAVYSLLRTEFGGAFGFTEPEVTDLLEAAGAPELREDVRAWYNGYLFGGQVVYNPWSLLNFLDSADRQFRPYWAASGSDDMLRGLLLGGGPAVAGDMEQLLRGEAIDRPIEENLVLRDVSQRSEALWSFLLFSGYLKALEVRDEDRRTVARLALPNEEVYRIFGGLYRGYLDQGLGGAGEVGALLRALLQGDAAAFAGYLGRLWQAAASYHDGAGPEPERVYQAFVLGLLVNLEPRYRVRSNRESGFGRYDVMVEPRTPGQPGVVIEFKTVDQNSGETPEGALESALRQVRDRDYACELRAAGAQPIHELAVVFDRKRVWVRGA